MLQYNEIPIRLRAGYSKYYEKQYGIRFGHIICEVCNEKLDKWILVDPDRKIVDLPENEFDFGCEAWINVNELTDMYQATGYFKSAGMDYESYVEMIMNRE